MTLRHRSAPAQAAQQYPIPDAKQYLEIVVEAADHIKSAPTPDEELTLPTSSALISHRMVHEARIKAHKLRILRAINDEEKVAQTKLKDHPTLVRLFLINAIAAPFTGLSAFLYLATTEGDKPVVVIDTSASNLFQDQYFLAVSVDEIIDAVIAGKFSEFIGRLMFGILFSLPAGAATYASATQKNQVMNLKGWDVYPLAQGAFALTGHIPLNLFARDSVYATLQDNFIIDLVKKAHSSIVKDDMSEILNRIQQIQEQAAKGLEAYIGTIAREEELDVFEMKRNFSFPEQINKMVHKHPAPKCPPPDSIEYTRFRQGTKVAGIAIALWSSSGYGAAMATVIVISMGAKIIIAHVSGHGMLTPLYVLSANAGATLEILAKLPWLIKMFYQNQNFRNYSLPLVIALAVSFAIALYSFGASLTLLQYVLPAWFATSTFSQDVTIGGTCYFNTAFGALPAEAIIRSMRRWILSWCNKDDTHNPARDEKAPEPTALAPLSTAASVKKWMSSFCNKEKAERQERYEQFFARLNQLSGFPVKLFISIAKQLSDEACTGVLCLDESTLHELRYLINRLDFQDRYKDALAVAKEMIPAVTTKPGETADEKAIHQGELTKHREAVSLLMRQTLGMFADAKNVRSTVSPAHMLDPFGGRETSPQSAGAADADVKSPLLTLKAESKRDDFVMKVDLPEDHENFSDLPIILPSTWRWKLA